MLNFGARPRAQEPVSGRWREALTVKVRCKAADGSRSKLLTLAAIDEGKGVSKASADLRFAAAVAWFGMNLHDSKYEGTYTLDGVIELDASSLGREPGAYRSEFVELARKVKELTEG